MSRVALYVRVSTEEQSKHGLSVDSQIEALTEYANNNNHIIVGLYSDAGISAHKTYTKRPALLQLLEDIKIGKIDLILFTKLDRWFRSVADYYEVQKVIEDNEVCWRAIWEDYETETSSGKFKVNIMLSVAQSESDRTSERIRKINEYKRARGEVCTGGVATGYKIKDKRWYFDEALKEGIDLFFKTYLDTFSITLSLKACDNAGFHFTNKNAFRFLRNPAYYGEPVYVAETYITREQHLIIEPTLKTTTRFNKFEHLFRGLIYCGECGHLMSPVGIRKDRSVYRARYTCSCHGQDRTKCKGSSVHEDFLETYLLDHLDKLLSDYYISAEITAQEIANPEKQINSTKAKIKRLKDLYLLGDLEIDDYKEKRDALLEELAKLEAITTVNNVPTLPSNWKEVYADLDKEHKASFWRKTIKRIEVKGFLCTSPVIKI